MRTIPIWDATFFVEAAPLKLSELPHRTAATVETVDDQAPNDTIARRLRELGFVAGERVEVMAAGPVAGHRLGHHIRTYSFQAARIFQHPP